MVKPNNRKTTFDGFTGGTVACLFSHTGFSTRTERYHHRDRQSHHKNRILYFGLVALQRASEVQSA